MMAPEMIVVRRGDILEAQVSEETVLMSVETGQYFNLTTTSRAIWERLKTPVCVRDLCTELAAAYQTPLETVETDTLAFLGYLEAQNMIETRTGIEPE